MKKYLTIFCVALLGLSCQTKRDFFPDNLTPLDVEIIRFDSALLSINPLNSDINKDVRNLYLKYPDFMPVFTEDILGISASDTQYLATALPKFLQDTLYGFKQTNNKVKQVFENINPIRNQLNSSFAKLQYLYPEIVLPQITLFISGFNASLFLWNTEEDYNISEHRPIRIAVGTDMYLGSDYEYYNRVVYNYQKQTMRPECIPIDIMSAYLFYSFPFNSTQSRLLENMIYRGKMIYLLSLLFPDETEAEIMGYTPQQLAWAQHFEAKIWQHMLDTHVLFSTQSPILSSYLNDGPFTAEVSQDAPPRLATWIGWKIAESYIKNNEQISLQELIQEPDAQKILELSNYRP